MDYSLDNLHLIAGLKKELDAKFIYLLPPDENVLLERLRGRKKVEEVTPRYEKAKHELDTRKSHPNWRMIDHELINWNLDRTLLNLEELALK